MVGKFLFLFVFFLIALSACFVFSAEAQAPAATKQAEARALFDKGNGLAKKARYFEALGAFERSFAASPKPVVLFNMGMCLKALDRPAAAAEVFERYLAEAGDSPKPDLREQAKKALRAIAGEVPRLFVKGAPLDAEIQIDDGLPRPLFEGLPADPGEHRIRITAAGYLDYETSFNAVSGEHTTLDVEMTLAPPSDNVPPSDNCASLSAAAITVDKQGAGKCPHQGSVPPGTVSLRETATDKIPLEKTSALSSEQKKKLAVQQASSSEAPASLSVEAPPAPKTGLSGPPHAASRRFFCSPLRTVWFSGSVVLFLGGAAMISVSYALYSKDSGRLDTLIPLNTAGWIVGGIGLGSAAAFVLSGLLATPGGNVATIAINPDPFHPMLFMARRF
jgi:hypothetical protein